MKACKTKSHSAGFTLIEIIVVIAIIGAVAMVIVPNLRFSVDSQIQSSLRQLLSQIRAAYDDSIFLHRTHRLVFNVKTGVYWVETPPVGFEGRPPAMLGHNEESVLKKDAKKRLFESFADIIKTDARRESTLSSYGNPIYYTVRSIPVVQRQVLTPPDWTEVNDAVIYKQAFASSVVCARFATNLTEKPVEFTDTVKNPNDDPKNFAFIYFLPDGSTSAASLQISLLNENGMVADDAPKYTLNLDTLTGQSRLIVGFDDANFN